MLQMAVWSPFLLQSRYWPGQVGSEILQPSSDCSPSVSGFLRYSSVAGGQEGQPSLHTSNISLSAAGLPQMADSLLLLASEQAVFQACRRQQQPCKGHPQRGAVMASPTSSNIAVQQEVRTGSHPRTPCTFQWLNQGCLGWLLSATSCLRAGSVPAMQMAILCRPRRAAVKAFPTLSEMAL